MDNKLIQMAEAGDIEAMKRLGMLYREATRPLKVFKKVRKPDKDLLEHFLSKSYEYFLKAAETGEDDSMVAVANCLEVGKGVEKNQYAAFEWYQKAAALDNVEAMNSLGEIYNSGIEGKVAKDNEKALAYFIKAIETKEMMFPHHRTIEKIIEIYCEEENFDEMERWLKELNVERAGEVLYRLPHRIKMTPENKLRLLKKAAEYENVPSIISLGSMYCSGGIVEQNYAKAMEMYKKAAALGDKSALCKIAEMYYCGDGVEQSDKMAFEWYMKAAKSGVGAIQVGRMYYKGCGVAQNFSEAIKYFQHALEHKSRKRFDTNESMAAEYLGRMYENGDGVEKNLNEAFKYYQIAASHIINVEMMYKVADMYYLGIGVEQNYEKALENYERSARYGYFKAAKKLIEMYELGEGVEQNIDKANEWRRKLKLPVPNAEE